jgi:hypothetical protein
MNKGGRADTTLARPIFFALAAFFLCSALVPTISTLIEVLTSGLSNGVLMGPESVDHTGCAVTDSLGGWLMLTCDDGAVNGALDKVEGDANLVGSAIRNFVQFHGVPLTCVAKGQALVCQAGDVVLNDHLRRHGFAPPSMVQARIQREAWLATLLGFAGAIVAFMYERLRERDSRTLTERAAREARNRHLELLRTQTTEVLNALQTALLEKLHCRTDEDQRIAADKISSATKAALALARDLTGVPLPNYRIHELQALMIDVMRFRAERYQAILSEINQQFNLIEQELRARLNE